MEELTEGTRIYYNGDMANQEGHGIISKVIKSRWGTQYKVNLDDGREFTVSACIFSSEYLGHGGTRFVTEKAYNVYREKQFANFRKFAEAQSAGSSH